MDHSGSLRRRLEERRGNAFGGADRSSALGGKAPQGAPTRAPQTQTQGSFGASRRESLQRRIDQRRAAATERTKVIVTPTEQIARTHVQHRELGTRVGQYLRHHPHGHGPGRHKGSRIGLDVGFSSRWGVHLSARYYDRPHWVSHRSHHVHTYFDRHHRLIHRIIWPRYYYPLCYRFGPRVIFRTVYPYYHRKYVFVSLGGYWPSHYDYVRYYWYGWHPYVWHGYYPVARQVATETHNYYTYNYYGSSGDVDGGAAYTDADAGGQYEIQPVDHTTWADVRAKLEQQEAAEPAPQTVADTRFEDGVKSFEAGDYDAAAQKFAVVMELAPNDMILPFAYAQSLFAAQRYDEAANVLRRALQQVTPEKEGVFYPRGLYAEDEVLFAQIDKLVDKLERFGYDADLQLLLGYHLLGVGETGYARAPLERASQDIENAEAARVLLELLDKMETEAGDATHKVEPESTETADVQSAAARKPPVQMKSQVSPAGAEQTSRETGGKRSVEKASPAGGETRPEQPGPQAGPDSEPPSAEESDVPAPPSQDDAQGAEPVGRLENGGPVPALAGIGPPGGRGPSFGADVALFALIVCCGWAAVYVQWRVGSGKGA